MIFTVILVIAFARFPSFLTFIGVLITIVVEVKNIYYI